MLSDHVSKDFLITLGKKFDETIFCKNKINLCMKIAN